MEGTKGSSRRKFLNSAAALFFAAAFRLRAESSRARRGFEVEALGRKYCSLPVSGHVRHYRIHAVVSLLGVPLIAKQDVGGALLCAEEHAQDGTHTTALQFYGGSWPAKLRGLNRFGAMQEVVHSDRDGITESAYLGFMTASPEKDFAQSRQSFGSGSQALFLAVSHGSSSVGRGTSGLDHITLPGAYTWLECARVANALRDMVRPASEQTRDGNAGALPTFLYAVRSAMLAASPFETDYVHAGKVYRLTANCVRKPSGQLFMTAGVRQAASREPSVFRVLFEPADPTGLPMTVEFRPRSFLTLRFEQSAQQLTEQPSPAIQSLLREEPS